MLRTLNLPLLLIAFQSVASHNIQTPSEPDIGGVSLLQQSLEVQTLIEVRYVEQHDTVAVEPMSPSTGVIMHAESFLTHYGNETSAVAVEPVIPSTSVIMDDEGDQGLTDFCQIMAPLWRRARKSMGLTDEVNIGEECRGLASFYLEAPVLFEDSDTFTFGDVDLKYIPIWKNGHDAIRCNLKRSQKQITAERRRTSPRSVSFSFARSPIERFSASYSEIQYRWQHNGSTKEGTCQGCAVGVENETFLHYEAESVDAARAFVSDLLSFKLSKRVYSHSHYQLAALVAWSRRAQERPADDSRVDFLGHLDSFEQGWTYVQSLANATFEPFDHECGAHSLTDAASGNAARNAMDQLTRDDESVILALGCAVLLPDAACLGDSFVSRAGQCEEAGFADAAGLPWGDVMARLRKALCPGTKVLKGSSGKSVADGEVDVMFVHIPKNGGTSVKKWMQATDNKRLGREVLHTASNATMPDGNRCCLTHLPPAYFPQAYRNKDTFCVSRNPYSRAVSEFKWVNAKWDFGCPPSESDPLVAHSPGCGKLPACSRERLNVFLQGMLRLVENGQPFVNDCHMLPQSEYIWGPNGTTWCDNILPLEELPEAFDRVMTMEGIDSRSSSRRENAAMGCDNLTVDDLDAETMRMIERVYKQDFDRLGYERSSTSWMEWKDPHPHATFVQLASRTAEAFPTKLGQCALVGSSAMMVGAGLGPEVDAHQTVIRVNTLPTAAYFADFGQKTDILALKYQSKRPGTDELVPTWNKTDIFFMGGDSTDALAKNSSELVGAIMFASGQGDTQFLQHVWELAAFPTGESLQWLGDAIGNLTIFKDTGLRPTRGLIFLMLFAPYCDTVRMYGFSDSKEEGDAFAADGHVNNVGGFHDYDAEHRLYDRIVEGKVTEADFTSKEQEPLRAVMENMYGRVTYVKTG